MALVGVLVQDVLKVYADNGSVVARIPGAHLVPKLRRKLGKYTYTRMTAIVTVESFCRYWCVT